MFKLEIKYDDYAENPRESGDWGDLATIAWVGGHRRIPSSSHDLVVSLKGAEEILQDPTKFVVDEYLDGNCLVYVDKAAFCKEHGHKAWNRHLKAKASRYIDAIVKEFNAYLEGEVYGYVITNTQTGNQEGSCWGFYGEEYAKEAGEEALAHFVAQAPAEVGLPGKVFTFC